MSEEKTAYPLAWPLSKPVTPANNRRVQNRFQTGFAKARDECLEEVRMLGGSKVIISTNIPLKRDGLPYAKAWGEQVAGSPGVAVYFTRKGKELCFACDCWHHVQDNMHAITLTISALRGIARWGTGDMMEAAFTGFLALPAPGQGNGDDPWKILGLPINFTEEQLRDAYRDLAKKHHPDKGGDHVAFARVKAAYDILAQNLRK